jgi:hypothetical protein
MELDSDGSAAAFPPMQERDGSRSRDGGRLILVRSRSDDGACEHYCFAGRLSRKVAKTAWARRGGTSAPIFASIAGLVPLDQANHGGSATVIPRLIDAPD